MPEPEFDDSLVLPQRKTLGHIPPPWIKSGAVFFITICTQPRGKNQLCLPAVSDQVFEAIEHRQKNQDWWCRLCLLMPDHLHALVSFPAGISMQRVVRNFKEHTAKRIGIFWQRDFFDHRLRNAENLQSKASYIRQNPVRAKLANTAANWPYFWEPR